MHLETNVVKQNYVPEVTNIDCSKIGKKKDLEKNGRKWNHGDPPNSGGKECCKPKTCADMKGEGGVMSCWKTR